MLNNIVVAVSTLIGFVVLALPICYLLAKLQWFFVFRIEGKAVGIVRGGELVDVVGKMADYDLIRTSDEANRYNNAHHPKVPVKRWGFVPLAQGEVPREVPRGPIARWLDNKFGLVWIGWWPFYQVYWYTLRASTIEINRDSSFSQPRHRNEASCFVYLKMALYYSKVIYVVRENVRIKFEYIFYLAGMNPYDAMFRTDDWFNAICGRLDARAIQYFGTNHYDTINVSKVPTVAPTTTIMVTAGATSGSLDASKVSFEEWMAGIGQEIETDFGFRLGPAMIINKGPADDDETAKDFVASFVAEQVAGQIGAGTVKEATMAAQAREQAGIGEEAYIRRTMQAKADGIGAELTARANGAKAMVEAFKGHPDKMEKVLNNEAALALFENPNTAVQVIAGGGSGGDLVRTIAASAQAIMNQMPSRTTVASPSPVTVAPTQTVVAPVSPSPATIPTPAPATPNPVSPAPAPTPVVAPRAKAKAPAKKTKKGVNP